MTIFDDFAKRSRYRWREQGAWHGAAGVGIDMMRPARPSQADPSSEAGRIASIERMVGRIVRDELSEARIDAVRVVPDVDSDGEPILRVSIVFDGTAPNVLDPRKMVGLVRHIRPHLANGYEDHFPMISYIEKSEAAKIARAAA